jgi:hypothetical protein
MNINSENPSQDVVGTAVEAEPFDIRKLSATQLAELGVSQIAYVKPVTVNGNIGYAIHAANGMPMGLAEDREVAIAAVLQHEMVPVPVH